MKKMMMRWLYVITCVAVGFTVAQAQYSILGKTAKDQFLSGFWSQNNNASNAVVGLNGNAPAAGVTLTNTLLPVVQYSKVLSNMTVSGTWTGTNSFKLQSWDSSAGAMVTYSLDVTGGLGATNAIVRWVDMTNQVRAMVTSGVAQATFYTNFESGQFLSSVSRIAISGYAPLTNANLLGASTPIRWKTVDYTVTTNDLVVMVDASGGAVTLVTPAASNCVGSLFVFKKVDSSTNLVTFNPVSSETVDGVATYVLTNQWDVLRVTTEGTNWFKL